MNRRKFFFQLFLLTIIMAGLSFFSGLVPLLRPHLLFFLGSIAFYFTISTVIFFTGAKAAFSKDKHSFTRVIMLCTFLKLLLTAVLVIGYHKLTTPGSNFFIIPFFLIYFAFTIFETLFLTRLGKIKAR